MAAITYWVRADGGGDDTNDGLTYANAFATHNGVAVEIDDAASDNNDYTINFVNDGTHTWDQSTRQIDGLPNNTYLIRGTDSSGTPALTSVEATAGVNVFTDAFFYIRDNSGITLEYFDFDLTGAGTTAAIYTRDNSSGTITVRFCRFIMATFPRTSNFNINPARRATGSGSSLEITGCYFQGASNDVVGLYAANAAAITKVHHNVFIDDTTSSTIARLFSLVFNPISQNPEFYNNTMYANLDTGFSGSWGDFASFNDATGDSGGIVLKNNVFWEDNETDATIGTSGTEFIAGASAGNSTFDGTEDIGYNMFYTGVAVSDNTPGNIANYNGAPWSPGVDDLYTGDVRRDNQADTATFFAPSSTYSWTPTDSAVSLTIAKDLRLIIDTSAGESSSTPGALPLATTDYSVQVSSTKLAANAGEAVTVRVALGNSGASGDAVVNVTTPTGLSVVSTTPSSGTYTAGVWSVTIADSAAETLTISALVDSGTEGTDLVVSAAIDASSDPGPGGDTSDDSDSVTISVVLPPPEESPDLVPFIDALPLKRPVLRLDLNTRFRTVRNRRQENYLRGDIEGVLWSEYRSQRVTIAASTTFEANLSGVLLGEYLVVESDGPVQVSVNGTDDADFLPAAEAVIIGKGQYDRLAIKNPSSTDSVSVLVLVVD